MPTDEPNAKPPKVYKTPSVPDTLEITNTDEDFPDSWNDEPGEYSRNEPEAAPLSDPSPLDSSQLL